MTPLTTSLWSWPKRQPVVFLVLAAAFWYGPYPLLIPADSGASFQSARQIAEAVKKAAPQPIKWVINTGGQGHRWLDRGYFKAQGGEIMAHAEAEADVKARGPEHLRANAPVLKEKMAGNEPTLPTRWLKDANTELELGGAAIEVVHRKGGHTLRDIMAWLSQSGVVFTGDVVYVDRILGLHPVSKTKAWVESFEALEALKPNVVVPGHGNVTTLAKAQADTGNLLKALRAHMGQAVAAGTDMSTAIKRFDASPYKHLKHVKVWLPAPAVAVALGQRPPPPPLIANRPPERYPRERAVNERTNGAGFPCMSLAPRRCWLTVPWQMTLGIQWM